MAVRADPTGKGPTAPADLERKAFYSPREYAALAGIHPSTVLDLIHSGRLWAVRISERIYRIPLAVVITTLYPGEKREPVVERTGDPEHAIAEEERASAAEGLPKRTKRGR